MGLQDKVGVGGSMRIGSIVRSNVDGSIGIVTEVRHPVPENWNPRYLVKFPTENPMWLSKNVLELICL